MPARCLYDYAVVRVVPLVERAEFLNVGVILSCPQRGFLEARIELDRARLSATFPWVDADVVSRHLGALVRISAGETSAGPIAGLTPRERFHWLVAPRSTVVQTSPVHTGFTDDPATEIERLMDVFVRSPRV